MQLSSSEEQHGEQQKVAVECKVKQRDLYSIMKPDIDEETLRSSAIVFQSIGVKYMKS